MRDSDATLILGRGPLTGGTALTLEFAVAYGKPVLVVDLSMKVDSDKVRRWLEEGGFSVLNVAGPREGHCHGIYKEALRLLKTLFDSAGRAH